VYKVVLVGELGVGKSSIFMRYRDNIFHDNYDGTKGMDHATKVIDTGKEKVSICLWDTGGMEKAGTLTSNHYKGAHGVLLTYAVNEISSLGTLPSWKENASRYSKEATYFLVGNKIDVGDYEKEVKESTISGFCQKHSIPFDNAFYISAKTDDGFKDMFKSIAKILKKSHIGQTEQNKGFRIVLDATDNKDRSKCCH